MTINESDWRYFRQVHSVNESFNMVEILVGLINLSLCFVLLKPRIILWYCVLLLFVAAQPCVLAPGFLLHLPLTYEPHWRNSSFCWQEVLWRLVEFRYYCTILAHVEYPCASLGFKVGSYFASFHIVMATSWVLHCMFANDSSTLSLTLHNFTRLLKNTQPVHVNYSY